MLVNCRVDDHGTGRHVGRSCALALAAALGLAACVQAPTVGPSARNDRAVEAVPSAATELESEWRPFTLPGKRATEYRFTRKEGRWAIEALADASASLLRRKLDIAPEQVGEVSWSWWVEEPLPLADLSDASRTDAPVRLMFAFEGDRMRLPLRARLAFDLARTLTGEEPPYATLVYTWGLREAPGTVMVNPRSDRVRKIVVDSGTEQTRRWRHHRRNLSADFRRAFGEAPGRLVGVAVMTDGDHTRSRVQAWYGQIHFHPAAGTPPCQASQAGSNCSPSNS